MAKSWLPRLELLEHRRVLAAVAVDDPGYETDQNTPLVAGADVSTEVISSGDYWDYLDQIKNQFDPGGSMGYPVDAEVDQWYEPDFDIATSTIGPWGNNPALFAAGGIDGGSAQTTVEGIGDGINGDNSVTTYLFRQEFVLADASAVHRLDFSMLLDDGGIFYINGVEVLRVNLPGGAVTTETGATTTGDEDNVVDFSVDVSSIPSLVLNDGANLIAVEVHNDDEESSDIGFDMSLSAVTSSGSGVLTNDIDAMLAVLDTDVSNGTLDFNNDGSFVYTPAPNFFGTDSFTYRAAETPASTQLITAGDGPEGQVWNFLHPLDGTDPAIADSDFNSTWFLNDGSYDGPAFTGSGQSIFGYGTIDYGEIVTNVGTPSSGDRYSAYFKTTFELDVDPSQVAGLTADILADDGAYVYINGIRVGQLNMSGGADTYTTLSEGGFGGGNENSLTEIILDHTSLVAGTNVIAISLHNQSPSFSSDLGLDFGMTAEIVPDLSDPATVTITVEDTGIPPVAVNDAYTAQVNQSLDTQAAGLASVLDNEGPITEMGDASFAVNVNDSGTHGTVVMDPSTGHFVFTPDTNFKGTTTFTYTITDDDGTSVPATVSISVEGDLITDNQQAIDPLGSLVYTSETNPLFDAPGQTHTFPVVFSAGQSVTLAATPDSAGLDLSIAIRDASSAIVASADTGGANAAEVIQNFLPASGDYTVEVTSESGSGNYSVQMVLGAAVEEEEHGGPSNDSQGTAQDLGSAFTDLGGGVADRAAVLGTGSTVNDDWYSFTLAGGQSATLAAEILGGLEVDVETVFQLDHTWRYNRTDNFTSGWHDTTYPVGGNWSSGPGLLGVESSTLSEPIRTTFGSYDSSRITYYFQTDFEFSGDPEEVSLALRHMVDDGAVFYLNGAEVLRFNMEPGTVTSTTQASDAPNNASLSGFVDLPTDALVVGTNRLSVEVHQSGTSSSDIVFGAELQIETPVNPEFELYDAGMNLVGTGTPSDNADFVIPNFVAPAAGTYFARIAGGSSPYNMVVVRGSDFDTEPNDAVDPDAQDISQTGHALGYVIDNLEDEGGTGAQVDHVIHISVDGLRSDLLQGLISSNPAEYDAFIQLENEGAFTYNARTDYTHTITLPNHTSMLTGRPVLAPDGQPDTVAHLWTTNSDPSPSQTLHNNHPSVDYIYSTFDVAHDADLLTRHYGNKTKFSIYEQSYSAAAGAPDTNPEGGDNGTDKIDDTLITDDLGAMITPFIAALNSTPDGERTYNFLHFADPDLVGHGSGWGSNDWNESVADVNDDLAALIAAINANPELAGKTAIVLTADHGGVNTGHFDADDPLVYTIPLYVWGPGFDGGANLYEVFSEFVVDPGADNPDYNDPNQPLRNGSTGNLSMVLLGLDPVPGSSIFVTESIAPPANLDHYSVDVTAGEPISVKTFTPTGGMSDLANNLDPAIEIYDPTGTLVASAEDGATDGLNVDFSYEAEMTGKYTVVVRADSTPEGDIFGEYFLDVNVGEDEPAATVEGRHVFYNDSFFDDATFGNDDDTAIDPTKSALLPGQTATNANYISYTRGINGIMVDIANPEGTVDAADFEFHDMGRNGDTPTAAQAPDSITVRPGEGVGGSDRVVMTWDTSAGIVFDTTWLRVTVLESVGLDAADVFYFGSAPGEGSGGEFAQVDPADELGARNNTHGFGNPATVDDPWDYNKDRFVDPVDQLFARNNGTGFTTRLNLMSAPAAGLLSAELSSGDSDGGPTAAALTGGESGWSTQDTDVLGDSSTGGGSSAAADERIWSEEDEEAVLVGSSANSSSAYSSDMDGALSEDADWLAWDVL
ncbi:MAG: Ig-like domain-containing protein [Pirellulales bacterium]